MINFRGALDKWLTKEDYYEPEGVARCPNCLFQTEAGHDGELCPECLRLYPEDFKADPIGFSKDCTLVWEEE